MRETIIYIFFTIVLITGLFADSHQKDSYNWKNLMKGKIEVEFIESAEGIPGTRMIFTLEKPIEPIWTILLDNHRGTKIYKEIEKMALIHEEKNTAIIEYWINPGLGKYNYVLKRIVDKESRQIFWTRLSGDFKLIEGSWTLKPTSDKGKTLLIYETFVDTGYPVPLFVEKWFAKIKVKDMAKSLRKYFKTL